MLDSFTVLGSAMAGLIRNYGSSDKGRQLALDFVTKYPNLDFAWNGWWIGETRPEAYQYLAEHESDKAKKIDYLMKIIEEHPRVWTGKEGSDDGGSYDMAAAYALLKLDSGEEKERICQKIIDSKAGPEVKEFVKAALKDLVLERDSAKLFVKPSSAAVFLPPCSYKYYFDATKISEEQFQKWLQFAPMQYKWKTAVERRQERLSELETLMKEVPPPVKGVLACYAKDLSFIGELDQRKGEFSASGDIAILKRPIGGVDPTKVCPDVLQKIAQAGSADERAHLVQFEWHNAVNSSFRKNLCRPMDEWAKFLDAYGIQEVRVACDDDD